MSPAPTYLALATVALPHVGIIDLPALCGVYADAPAALAYVAWENERADDWVYYAIPAADLVEA